MFLFLCQCRHVFLCHNIINCKPEAEKVRALHYSATVKNSKFVRLWNIFLDPSFPHVSGNYRQSDTNT